MSQNGAHYLDECVYGSLGRVVLCVPPQVCVDLVLLFPIFRSFISLGTMDIVANFSSVLPFLFSILPHRL
jgi:hypothetical protein